MGKDYVRLQMSWMSPATLSTNVSGECGELRGASDGMSRATAPDARCVIAYMASVNIRIGVNSALHGLEGLCRPSAASDRVD